MTDTRGSTAERATASRHGPGSVVGERFLIEETAGSGGMGPIFRAKDLQTEKTAAQDRRGLDASAAHIVDPAWRRRFIEDIPEHRRLAEVTVRWLPS